MIEDILKELVSTLKDTNALLAQIAEDKTMPPMNEVSEGHQEKDPTDKVETEDKAANESEFTKDDVRKALVNIPQEQGKKIVAMFSDNKKLSGVKEEDYGSLIEETKKVAA